MTRSLQALGFLEEGQSIEAKFAEGEKFPEIGEIDRNQEGGFLLRSTYDFEEISLDGTLTADSNTGEKFYFGNLKGTTARMLLRSDLLGQGIEAVVTKGREGRYLRALEDIMPVPKYEAKFQIAPISRGGLATILRCVIDRS